MNLKLLELHMSLQVLRLNPGTFWWILFQAFTLFPRFILFTPTNAVTTTGGIPPTSRTTTGQIRLLQYTPKYCAGGVFGRCPTNDNYYSCEDVPVMFEGRAYILVIFVYYLLIYQQLDISRTGQKVVWATNANILYGDDANSGRLPLPFRFTFYGKDYTGVYICSNGNVAVLLITSLCCVL
jgi:hypothetical protein